MRPSSLALCPVDGVTDRSGRQVSLTLVLRCTNPRLTPTPTLPVAGDGHVAEIANGSPSPSGDGARGRG